MNCTIQARYFILTQLLKAHWRFHARCTLLARLDHQHACNLVWVC